MKTTEIPEVEDVMVLRVTDHLFRHESGKLISVLTGIFGVSRLQMVEDVVQEAMARALQTWPYYGIPENPSAWLMQTAKHLAIDLIRRETRFREKQPELITFIEQRIPDSGKEAGPLFEEEIADDRLRLMFACCHPHLPREMQTALALKILCGFGPGEIAKAFLISEAAVAKRLVRARQRLQAETVRFEIPAGPELSARLEGVLQTLYLLFNEGYKASGGERVVREELCAEAIRLVRLLADHPVVSQPMVHALLALMLLNGARLPARMDAEGNILRLGEQDRALWNQSMIQQGIFHLGKSAGSDTLHEYHLEAGIAACHSLAPDDMATDWKRILSLYDHLTELNDSPVIALNRAVAVAKVHGPAEGISHVEAILAKTQLDSYYLTHAVLGELERQREQFAVAALHFQKALQLVEVESERIFLNHRLQECGAS